MRNAECAVAEESSMQSLAGLHPECHLLTRPWNRRHSVAAILGSGFVACSSQIHGGYAPRSRLAPGQNPSVQSVFYPTVWSGQLSCAWGLKTYWPRPDSHHKITGANRAVYAVSSKHFHRERFVWRPRPGARRISAKVNGRNPDFVFLAPLKTKASLETTQHIKQ
jgi:hypothetical protein